MEMAVDVKIYFAQLQFYQFKHFESNIASETKSIP